MASVARRALVVRASEQIWPNVHSLVYWHQHAGGLSDLCIYHSDDSERSEKPAKRLERLCQTLFPEITVRRPLRKRDITPQDVYHQLKHWQEIIPDRQWIINATGGLKLMFAGTLGMIEEPNTEVVYRELSGEWFQLRGDGRHVSAEPFCVPSRPFLHRADGHGVKVVLDGNVTAGMHP